MAYSECRSSNVFVGRSYHQILPSGQSSCLLGINLVPRTYTHDRAVVPDQVATRLYRAQPGRHRPDSVLGHLSCHRMVLPLPPICDHVSRHIRPSLLPSTLLRHLNSRLLCRLVHTDSQQQASMGHLQYPVRYDHWPLYSVRANRVRYARQQPTVGLSEMVQHMESDGRLIPTRRAMMVIPTTILKCIRTEQNTMPDMQVIGSR